MMPEERTNHVQLFQLLRTEFHFFEGLAEGCGSTKAAGKIQNLRRTLNKFEEDHPKEFEERKQTNAEEA